MHEANEEMIDDIVWLICLLQDRSTLLDRYEPEFISLAAELFEPI